MARVTDRFGVLILLACLGSVSVGQQFAGHATGLFSTMAPVPFAPWGWRGDGVVGDFNGDGLPDALYTHISGYMLIAGDGQGLPVSATLLPTPGIMQTGTPLALPDLDGNGLRDIFDTGIYGVRLNFGAGGVAAQYTLPDYGAGPAAIADFDGNGFVEIVSTTIGPTFTVRVHELQLTHATLLFEYTDPAILDQVAVGDFNTDGLLDFVVTRSDGFALSLLVFLRTPAGSFQLSQMPAVTGVAQSAMTGDINGDGLEDVVLLGGHTHISAFRFLNTGTGLTPLPTLSPPEVQTIFGWNYNPALADFDGDGCDELLARGMLFRMDPAFDSVPALLVDPSKILLVSGINVCPSTCCSSLSGDMNLDGAPDIIFTCDVQGGVQASYSAISLNLRNHRSPCLSGPTLYMGTPALGNNAFFLAASGAPPFMPALLGVSLGESNVTWLGGCALGPDPDPSVRLLPLGPLGITTTDASGVASLSLPLPNHPALLGASVFAQWIIQVPGANGPFSINGTPWTLTNSRRIVFW